MGNGTDGNFKNKTQNNSGIPLVVINNDVDNDDKNKGDIQKSNLKRSVMEAVNSEKHSQENDIVGPLAAEKKGNWRLPYFTLNLKLIHDF